MFCEYFCGSVNCSLGSLPLESLCDLELSRIISLRLEQFETTILSVARNVTFLLTALTSLNNILRKQWYEMSSILSGLSEFTSV